MLIPLIDKQIKPEMLNDTFVGVYTYDINFPADNEIYLMFKDKISDSHIYNSMTSLDSYKNLTCYTINKVRYDIYRFTLVDKDLRNLLNNNFNISNESKSRIYNFWDDTKDLVDAFSGPIHDKTYFSSIIPEMDRQLSFEEYLLDMEKGLKMEYETINSPLSK